jgi:hypothetical protein
VSSAELTLRYDPEVLAPVGIHKTRLTRYSTLAYRIDPRGLVRLFMRNEEPVFEAGDVAWIVFRVIGEAGEASPLTWTRCRLNESAVDSETTDGFVFVTLADATLSLPDDLTFGPGESFIAPLVATPADGILAADIEVGFSSQVVQAVDVTKTDITENATLTFNLGIPDKALISVFSTVPLVGTGPLVDIVFDVTGEPGESTPLDLVSASLNEGMIGVILDDGSFIVCDNSDADGDQQSICEGDCNDDDPDINSDATEVCDGVDNDCDDVIDNAAPPTSLATMTLESTPGATRLSWTALPDATGYDVVRGLLRSLIDSSGDFTAATESCRADDTIETFVDDSDPVPAGDGFWYVVRPVNCGGDGSYDSGGLHQAESRDAEIEASPLACP